MRAYQSAKAYFLFVLAFVAFLVFTTLASADVISTIRTKISDTGREIQKIEEEIREYQAELEEIGGAKKTLQSEISRLNISAKKLGADISLTESKIQNTNFTITELQIKIEEKGESIEKHKKAIMSSIRSIQISDDTSLIEAVLSHKSLTDFWADVDSLESFQGKLKNGIENLKDLRAGMQKNKDEELKKRKELASLKSSLEDQRQIVEYNKRDKDNILSVTKNEESRYQEYLRDAEIRREQFERELAQLESDLKIAIDPSLIPRSGKGVLFWPLEKIIITQRFGNTAFAKSGAYNGKGHNGVDFGTPVGTPVRAAGSGIVEATGNTDEIRGCYSYGKWVLIKHPTGLSTLYAHLSIIKATTGQSVAVGDTIAYSGNSGYSTGPHLHFTVYATQGVRVTRLGDIKTITNCANAVMPIAPFEAYLNPLDYL